MKKMFCQKCGHRHESPGGIFCMKCGASLGGSPEPPQQSQVQPPQQDPYGQPQPQYGQAPPQPTQMQPPSQAPQPQYGQAPPPQPQYVQPQMQPQQPQSPYGQMQPTSTLGPRPTPQNQYGQMQAQPSSYYQAPMQKPASQGKSPKLFILIGSGAAVILIAVLLFFFVLGGNPIVGTWESQDGWNNWHERVVFNRNGTVDVYEINLVTGEIDREDDPNISIRWSISDDILVLEFWYHGILEDQDEVEFRIVRNVITGQRYLGVLEGNIWEEFRRVGR